MGDFTLSLNGQSYTFDRSRLVRLFPESLMARALDLDPSAPGFDITSPDVTPNILSLIETMVRTGRIPPFNINLDELYRAYRYFGIDILRVLADYHYEDFLTRFDINLLDITLLNDPLYYYNLLWYSLRNNFTTLVEYIFDRTNPEPFRYMDERFLLVAIMLDEAEIISLYNRRGIPITSAKLDAEYMFRIDPEHMYNSYYDYTRLNDPVQFLKWAISIMTPHAFQLLLESHVLNLSPSIIRELLWRPSFIQIFDKM